MRVRRDTASLLVLSYFAITAHAQLSPGAGSRPVRDSGGLYLGSPVENPEALSGVWETSNGQSGAVGIHLKLTTTISAGLDPPAWAPQNWEHLRLGVFERKGSEIVFGDENSFDEGAFTLEGDHLQLYYVMPNSEIPAANRVAKVLGIEEPSRVDVDLIYGSDDCWRGQFHRGHFDSRLTLCRPSPESGVASDELVGTWSTNWLGWRDCVHIFENSPHTFTAWADSFEVPGGHMFWPSLHENYGALIKVRHVKDGDVSMELGAYSPLCCSQTFKGRLSTDGSSLSGAFLPSPNHVPRAAQWTRVVGNSCRSSSF